MNVLKRIPLAMVAIIASLVILSCTRSTAVPSAEAAADAPVVARPIPPNWSPLQVARAQDRLNIDVFRQHINNPGTAEEIALQAKNNMMRGPDVKIVSALDILFDRQGRIFEKSTQTRAVRNDGNFANWWVESEAFSDGVGQHTNVRRPNTDAGMTKRMFAIVSENGSLRKLDQGIREF